MEAATTIAVDAVWSGLQLLTDTEFKQVKVIFCICLIFHFGFFLFFLFFVMFYLVCVPVPFYPLDDILVNVLRIGIVQSLSASLPSALALCCGMRSGKKKVQR